MKMICCGLEYSTDDPETFWCIEKFGISPVTQMFACGQRVDKEVVYLLLCKKNGCVKIEIHRFSDEGVLLEAEKLNGYKAQRFLNITFDSRYRIKPEFPRIKTFSKRVPLVYGKTINGYTQKVRYITEEGWANEEKIHVPVRAYKLEF